MRVVQNAIVANQSGKTGRVLSTETVLMTNEVKCNKCAKVMWYADISDHPPTPEYLTVLAQWGKNSKWPGEMHEFHLCQKCYEQMILQFKIKDVIPKD